MEAVVDLRDLELLELDRGRVEREPHGERELGVHQEGRLHGKAMVSLLLLAHVELLEPACLR